MRSFESDLKPQQQVAFAEDSSFKDVAICGVLILSLLLKVLWGYWCRDLTFGDTSSYFVDAVRWHLTGQNNIVWSPLYTAYYGLWLSITDNAAVATLLHRIGLIVITTSLVAWLGYLTLPRLLAFLVVLWWVALPIHYDTLYEVHLFGALPLLILAVVSVGASEWWRRPLLLAVSLLSAVLIRNEYVLVFFIFLMWFSFVWLRQSLHKSRAESVSFFPAVRYGAALLIVSLVIGYFYTNSYVQGDEIRRQSMPKHTLNMCQVYAFGYQQRHSDWNGSPWTDCPGLMQKEFGAPFPTLREMIAANPRKVIEHFAWNLSLTRAGVEVLLFNTTSSKDNPDYAPVFVMPLLPTVLFWITILVGATGLTLVLRTESSKFVYERAVLLRMLPLLLCVVVTVVAVILTQRPRPSYLLGGGVLYVWFVLLMLSSMLKRIDLIPGRKMAIGAFLAALVLVPSYSAIKLPSKEGSLGMIYNAVLPQTNRLCLGQGFVTFGDYSSELFNYLCSPTVMGGKPRRSLSSVYSLSDERFKSAQDFVAALEEMKVGALVVDPFLILKRPGLGDCGVLRDLLIKNGWELLVYSSVDSNRCVAAYVK